MSTARQPSRPTASGSPPQGNDAGRSVMRSCAAEALEPRLALTGSYGIDSPDAEPDEALVAPPVETEPIAHPLSAPAGHDVNPLSGSSAPGGFTPSEIRQAYGFDQVFFDGGTIVGDGTGQTIAIVNAFHTPNAAADLAAFNAYFGLPDAPSFVQVDQNGGTNYPGSDSGWAQETALDVQWAHAFAPGADILLVEADSASFSDLMVAVDYARSQPNVSVVSMSWGTSGEFSSQVNFDAHFTTPVGHDGVTFFAAAGNSGGPGGYPAYSSNVVAVGGTSLVLDGANNIASEVAWSDSGGGISQFEPQPFWQNGVVTQTATQRAMPDVAFNADPQTGVPVYDTYNNSPSAPWSKIAGTSFATPSWAALVAVANQGRELAGLSQFDMTELMTTLYAMPADNFNDITTGTSGGTIPQSAGPGYDLVTGRGSPKAAQVVASLVGIATIDGTVFDDANGNGTLDGESGLAGWTVYADLNTNGALDAASVDTFHSNDIPLAISVFDTSTITSDNVVSGVTGLVLDVNVTLDISHTRTSDLTITLVAPDGAEIVLAEQVGGTGNDFNNTVFDDSAATPIAAGAAPFSGSFQPDESLAALLGQGANGTWQLRVADSLFFEGGSLNSWSLEITSGEPSTLSEADGTYRLAGLPDGAYQIRQVVQSPYVQTAPGGGFHTVVLADGQSVTGRDFGNQLPLAPAIVTGRHVFYENSSFDGGAGIDAADSAAIATDKVAYLPGSGVITLASMTSYSRGLNGLFVDLAGAHGTLSLADFSFKVSNQGSGATGANNTPSTWSEAPAPIGFTVLADQPTAGTDRVEFIWADGAIENRYLEITVKGNDAAGGFNTNTGLASSDVFYFGNLVGDTFNDASPTTFVTTASDETAIQAQIVSTAEITSLWDMDRNGVHLASDRIVTRGNTVTALAKIDVGNPPAAPSPTPNAAPRGAENSPAPSDDSQTIPSGVAFSVDVDSRPNRSSAVASALTIPGLPGRAAHTSADAPQPADGTAAGFRAARPLDLTTIASWPEAWDADDDDAAQLELDELLELLAARRDSRS